jgi:hypothetical protein
MPLIPSTHAVKGCRWRTPVRVPEDSDTLHPTHAQCMPEKSVCSCLFIVGRVAAPATHNKVVPEGATCS